MVGDYSLDVLAIAKPATAVLRLVRRPEDMGSASAVSLAKVLAVVLATAGQCSRRGAGAQGGDV